MELYKSHVRALNAIIRLAPPAMKAKGLSLIQGINNGDVFMPSLEFLLRKLDLPPLDDTRIYAISSTLTIVTEKGIISFVPTLDGTKHLKVFCTAGIHYSKQNRDETIFYRGTICSCCPEIGFEMSEDSLILVTSEGEWLKIEPEHIDKITDDFRGLIHRCLQLYEEINKPQVTWLCERPRTEKQKIKLKKEKKLQHTTDRPVIIVLDPDEVKTIYAQREKPTGTHASPIPHKRRAHTRTYKHERYKNMQGLTIGIPEMTINAKVGDTFTVRKKIYLVMKVGDTSPIQGMMV